MRKIIASTVFIDEFGKEYTIRKIEEYLSAKTLNEPWKTKPQFIVYELEDGTELSVLSCDELVIPESGLRLSRKQE